MDLEDGIERRFHGSADEFERAPHECWTCRGYEDARHAPASDGVPPNYGQRSPVPPGSFIVPSVSLLHGV